MQITKDYLLSHGYTKYPTTMDKQYADCFYQRKITDKKGIKYFINIYHYPKVKHFDFSIDESWELLIQIGDTRLERSFLGLTVPEIENLCEKFWKHVCDSKYYELYDEE